MVARRATSNAAADQNRFAADVQAMGQSGAKWQLFTSYNEWGEGQSIEAGSGSGYNWNSSSGHGFYMDTAKLVYG